MTLIAATAVGLSLARSSWVRNHAHPTNWIYTWNLTARASRGYPSKTWMLPVAERVAPLLPCLAAWSAAIIVIRCVPPRPRRRRLVAQPGLVAAVVVVATLITESALLLGAAMVDGRHGSSDPPSFGNGIVLLAHHAGWSVAASWLTLAFIGRWRPEASWIDRLGRLLAFAWIVIGPLASLLLDHSIWWFDFLGR
jgi:hypothetical protein